MPLKGAHIGKVGVIMSVIGTAGTNIKLYGEDTLVTIDAPGFLETGDLAMPLVDHAQFRRQHEGCTSQ